MQTEGTLITQSGNNNIDLLVNEIKSKVLTSLKLLWNYLFKKKPKDLYSVQNVYVQAAQ